MIVGLYVVNDFEKFNVNKKEQEPHVLGPKELLLFTRGGGTCDSDPNLAYDVCILVYSWV